MPTTAPLRKNYPIRTIYSVEYPFQLRQIPRLPKSMEIIGSLPGPDYKYLCIVGSRHYTSYGKTVCSRLIAGLRGYPIVIVSGLAIGIDSQAHEAALSAQLPTVAFPGSGLAPDVLYPRSKTSLAYRIVDNGGALVSAFVHDQQATRWTFPVRNRLMAGISHAVLIIEGGKDSGTLLTAHDAADFNRHTMAVPGSVLSEHSYGPNSLIREGVAAVTCSADVLEGLGFDVAAEHLYTRPDMSELPPGARRILEELQFSPLSATGLIDKVHVSVESLYALLSDLELKGFIVQLGELYKLKQ